MAIVKHIKSRNANYSAAINYLLFEHDEKTGKKILDESGRSILRKEFYMDGLNCDPMSFDKTRYYLVGYTLDKPYSLRLDYTPLAGRTSHALYAKWCIRICQSTCYCSYNHRI